MKLIHCKYSYNYNRNCYPLMKCWLQSNNQCIQTNINRHYCELSSYLSQFPAKHPQKECERFWSYFWQKNRLFNAYDSCRQSSDGVELRCDDRLDCPSAQHNHKRRSDDCSAGNGSTSASSGGSGSSGQLFSVLLPPPNITGSLHLGHALTLSIEDSICRYHRMKGHRVVWIPGLDHAGIATQVMVEKMVWTKEKKRRHELSRHQFLAKVNEWKAQRSSEIREQLVRLGVSLDFDKEFFTLSDSMSEAVNEAFVRLFNSGQIYRRSLAVNWSYFMRSTISDIEVDKKQITGPTQLSIPGFDGTVLVGVIHRFNYPIEGNSSHSDIIPVATTRLETILGDVAIAVHPTDSRYSHLIGKNAVNPLNGRLMPIISDESVKPDFGTGAVKITPGHSQQDYTLAERHSLPVLDIFDSSGRLYCPELPQFHGLHRFEAKEVMKTELHNKGLYIDQSDHKHSIPICSRSGDLIECRRVPQWFLKSEKHKVLAQFMVNRDYMNGSDEHKWNSFKEELKAEDRHLSVIPPNYRNVWREWFGRYEDWCISRQIDWGHRIPAYNVIKDNQLTDEWIAAKSESEAQTIAEKKYPTHAIGLKRDDDVLDTWFSSALLPLSVNGWPEVDSTKLQYFPLSLMETGYDILFFWVARMLLLSLSLTGRIPFRRVLLHGMICDPNGKKMSKSKGNVIDPIDVIDGISLKRMKHKNLIAYESGVLSKSQLDLSNKQLDRELPNGIIDCGADALRFGLLQTDFKEEKVVFDIKHVIANRNFCNKMHQTVRFLISNVDHRFRKQTISELAQHLSPIDRWILSSLVAVVKKCNQCMASYDLQYGALGLRHFWTDQLCDIYLEDIKEVIHSNADNERRLCVLNVLAECLLTGLRAIHPFMPFISENLWQHLNQRLFADRVGQEFKSICQQSYPDLSCDQFMIDFDFNIQREMRLVEAIVKKIRWFQTNFRINKNLLEKDVLIAINGNHLDSYRNLIRKSSKVVGIDFVSIHDIHKYDKCFCYKIQSETIPKTKQYKQYNTMNTMNTTNKQNSDTNGTEIQDFVKNGFDDCYVLFDIDFDSIVQSMTKLGLKAEEIEEKSIELLEYECIHFHKHFWRTKSLRNKNISNIF